MRTNDFEINVRIRSIMVRHTIDTRHCHYETFNGKVLLRGRLQKAGAKRAAFSNNKDEPDRQATFNVLSLAMTLEDAIRSIPGVEGIRCQFDNVSKERGKWRTK